MELSKEWNDFAETTYNISLTQKGFLDGSQHYANKVEELLNESIKELTEEVEYLSKDHWDTQYVEFSGKLEFAKQLLTELKTLKP